MDQKILNPYLDKSYRKCVNFLGNSHNGSMQLDYAEESKLGKKYQVTS